MPSTEPDFRFQEGTDALVHVAVGVIEDSEGRILIARRPEHVHQGGLWEFPGGKIEEGETVEHALRRELQEELGIRVEDSKPLIQISHRYPEVSVLLDVWRVKHFSGTATGLEGQEIQWVDSRQLHCFDFPAANRPVISAALLPDCYAILEGHNEQQIFRNLEAMFDNGIRLVQLRLKTFTASLSPSVVQPIVTECVKRQISVLVNSALPCNAAEIGQGIHLTSRDLLRCERRPDDFRWVAASCHTMTELKRAEAIGVDFVVLAPVQATRSHPDTPPLGWRQFTELVDQCNLPVYALGGLKMSDLDRARSAGAQGIAGISAFQSFYVDSTLAGRGNECLLPDRKKT